MNSIIKNQELIEKILVNPLNGNSVKLEIYDQSCYIICNNSNSKIGELNQGVLEFYNNKSSKNSKKNKTIEMFGHEWQHYSKWGWLDELPDEINSQYNYRGGLKEHSKSALYSKTRLKGSDFKDKIVLEGGCGNGRHSQFVKEHARLLICIDPSNAIYEASENLKNSPNVVFIKANLLDLPFIEKSFDLIFSIGVLQHTGDSQRVLKEIGRCIKPNGIFGLNCYGTGYFPYEFFDYMIRVFTSRLSRKNQLKFAGLLSNLSIFLIKNRLIGIYKLILFFININPSKCIMYDWYSPRLADHYSRKALKKMLKESKFIIMDSNVAINELTVKYFYHKFFHSAFNLKLKKQP